MTDRNPTYIVLDGGYEGLIFKDTPEQVKAARIKRAREILMLTEWFDIRARGACMSVKYLAQELVNLKDGEMTEVASQLAETAAGQGWNNQGDGITAVDFANLLHHWARLRVETEKE